MESAAVAAMGDGLFTAKSARLRDIDQTTTDIKDQLRERFNKLVKWQREHPDKCSLDADVRLSDEEQEQIDREVEKSRAARAAAAAEKAKREEEERRRLSEAEHLRNVRSGDGADDDWDEGEDDDEETQKFDKAYHTKAFLTFRSAMRKVMTVNRVMRGKSISPARKQPAEQDDNVERGGASSEDDYEARLQRVKAGGIFGRLKARIARARKAESSDSSDDDTETGRGPQRGDKKLDVRKEKALPAWASGDPNPNSSLKSISGIPAPSVREMIQSLDDAPRSTDKADEEIIEESDPRPCRLAGGLDQQASLRAAVARGALEERRLMARAAHVVEAGHEEMKYAGDRPLSAGSGAAKVPGALAEDIISSSGILRFAHSKLDTRSMEALCRSIVLAAAGEMDDGDGRVPDAQKGSGLAPNTAPKGITAIDLRGNSLDLEAVSLLINALLEVRTVEDLDLSDNRELGSAGAEALCAVLPCTVNDREPGLRVLSLVNTGIGSAGAISLATVLERNSTLTRLDISNCDIRDAGAVAFGGVLAENVTLKVCNLSWNGIRYRGAHAISEGLRFNNTLVSLDLSHNERMGDAGVSSFGASLDENSTLETLDLSSTGAGKASALVISEALDSNKAIRVLRLNNNPLTVTGIRRLAHGLLLNESLEVLNLQGCILFDADLMAANARDEAKKRAALKESKAKGSKKKKGQGGAKKGGAKKEASGTPGTANKMKKGGGGEESSQGSGPHRKDPIDFSRSTPNGIYTLRLSDPFEHQVAIELTYVWHKHGSASWKWAKLDDKDFTLTVADNWPQRMPDTGVLEVAVYVRRLLEHQLTKEETADRVFRILAAEVNAKASPEWWRIQFIRALSATLYFTCEQCAELVSRIELTGGGGASSPRVDAVLALFPRIVDPQNFEATILIPLMSDQAVEQLILRLGPLTVFARHNPTGRYMFNLSVM